MADDLPRPQPMAVFPHEIEIFDVVSEGQMVYSLTIEGLYPDAPKRVHLHVGLPRIVEREGYKHAMFDHPSTIAFFNNYVTGDMALQRRIPIIRGMYPSGPNGAIHS